MKTESEIRITSIIPREKLEAYFKANSNRVTTKENVVIELFDNEIFHTSAVLEECNGVKYELRHEMRDVVEYIDEYKIVK